MIHVKNFQFNMTVHQTIVENVSFSKGGYYKLNGNWPYTLCIILLN